MILLTKVICLPFRFSDINITDDYSFVLRGYDVFYDHNENIVLGKIKGIKYNENEKCLYASLDLRDEELGKIGLSCDSLCSFDGVGVSLGGVQDYDEKVIYIDEISITPYPAEERTLGAHFFIKLNKNVKKNSIIYMNMTEQQIAEFVSQMQDFVSVMSAKFDELAAKIDDLSKRVEKAEADLSILTKTKEEAEVAMSKYRSQLDSILAEALSSVRESMSMLKNFKV